MNDFNKQIIEEFRANKGVVGGMFEGATMILLDTIGAKSGEVRTTPLVYQADGDRYVVFASAGGSTKAPDWYHNIIANPKFSVEVGTEKFEVKATEVTGDERTRIWEKQKQDMPGFADYEKSANREIPVIALERA